MKSNEPSANVKLADQVEIIPLGGGCEVGRSCILLRFRGKTVMLDCGLHPSDNDFSCLPFFDKIDPSEVDLLLVTHFHLDHCGSVPYFLQKTSFKGRTIMTYPTKAIYKHLLLDSLKVGSQDETKSLYGAQEVLDSLEKIKAVNFHEEVEYKEIKFTAYNAGHVIGAAMFIIEIAGVKILYTGDYSREEDMHIVPAEIPKTEIDILIVESTYGNKTHEPRERREKYFLETVEKIVRRGGKCLLPVFVLGRAQELLLMLDNYWARKEELQGVPIYYASTLMGKCMLIFQTYINMMGKNVRERMKKGDNPFDFRFIKEHRGGEVIEESDRPLVVMASPGMLQKGLSRTLFQRWCPDERNGVVFTGYCVENTLAYDILHKSKNEFTNDRGQVLKIKMSREYISFSAHADMEQTKEFIELVKPKLVVLVHGEKHEAMRLKGELEKTFGNKIEFKAPINWEPVRMKVHQKEKCKLIGELAEEICDAERRFREDAANQNEGLKMLVDSESLLFKRNNRYFICRDEDMHKVIKDRSLPIRQTLHLPFRHSMDLVAFLVPQAFPATKVTGPLGGQKITIHDEVSVKKGSQDELVIDWTSSERNDIIGDCLAYFLYELNQHDDIDMFQHDPHDPDRQRVVPDAHSSVLSILRDNFGVENVREAAGKVAIQSDGETIAELNSDTFALIQCKNEVLKERIQALIQSGK